jgi:hypothetical protein
LNQNELEFGPQRPFPKLPILLFGIVGIVAGWVYTKYYTIPNPPMISYVISIIIIGLAGFFIGLVASYILHNIHILVRIIVEKIRSILR